MSEVVKSLQERRMRVWEQAKTLADAAAEENRTFSGEEESNWQTLNAELDALDKRIKAVIDGEQRAPSPPAARWGMPSARTPSSAPAPASHAASSWTPRPA